MKTLEQRAGVDGEALDAVLSRHFLDPSALREGDFDAFFSNRRQALINLISAAMGKPVIEDLVEAAEASDAAEYEPEADDVTDDDLIPRDVPA